VVGILDEEDGCTGGFVGVFDDVTFVGVVVVSMVVGILDEEDGCTGGFVGCFDDVTFVGVIIVG